MIVGNHEFSNLKENRTKIKMQKTKNKGTMRLPDPTLGQHWHLTHQLHGEATAIKRENRP